LALRKIKEDLEQIDGMPDIHNFHIWNLSVNKPLLKVHLDVQNGDCQTNNVSAKHLY
jgi:Co/Zn/Cd efflux system component